MSNYERIKENLARYRREKAASVQKISTDDVPSPLTREDEEVATVTDDKLPKNDPINGGKINSNLDSINNQSPSAVTNEDNNSSTQNSSSTVDRWVLPIIKFSLWCVLQVLFVELEFGVAFFIASCLFFIVYSLRGSRRKANEVSAYSVFNKDFERIEGTLTAEQFEREIRHGPTAVH